MEDENDTNDLLDAPTLVNGMILVGGKQERNERLTDDSKIWRCWFRD